MTADEILRRQAGIGGLPRCTARYVITGELVLDSATHVGNGQAGDNIDMILLRDPVSSAVFLPGTSLAGALRSYANDYLLGYGVDEAFAEDGNAVRMIRALFGWAEGDGGECSALNVFDSYMLASSDGSALTELRDGVAIDPRTGTAADHKKYDMEILPRGTRFSLHLELAVPGDGKGEDELVSLLYVVLAGLQRKEIRIGSRRTRGFGLCYAERWRVRRFDLTNAAGWAEWLKLAPRAGGPDLGVPAHERIDEALSAAMAGEVALRPLQDRRQHVSIHLSLQFPGAVLVRSAPGNATAADVTHLNSAGTPILPGTSLVGAMRSRARRIARLVRNREGGPGDGDEWVEWLFGPGEGSTRQDPEGNRLFASRVRVSEGRIDQGTALRVGRIKVDRFTGGVVDGALFEEEPLYGGQTELDLELQVPRETEDRAEAQLGLLLLVIKDLVTANLALGGTQGVGRGYVEGAVVIRAKGLKCLADDREYRFDGLGESPVDAATAEALNSLVAAFHTAPSCRRPTQEGGADR